MMLHFIFFSYMCLSLSVTKEKKLWIGVLVSGGVNIVALWNKWRLQKNNVSQAEFFLTILGRSKKKVNLLKMMLCARMCK